MNDINGELKKYVGLIPFSSQDEKFAYIKQCESIISAKIADVTCVNIDSVRFHESMAVRFSWAAVFTFKIASKSKITCYVGSPPSSAGILRVNSKNELQLHTQRILDQEICSGKALSDAFSYVNEFKYGQNLDIAVIVHRSPKCVVWEYTCTDCHGKKCITCTTCEGDGKVTCGTCNGRGQRICEKCSGSGLTCCSSCYGQGYNNCSHCGGIGHDSSGRSCCLCYGSGKKSCYVCSGSGEDRCPSCYGSGEVDCGRCRTSGMLTCSQCEGDGIITCPHCKGKGILHEVGEAHTNCSGQKKFHIPPQFTAFNENINTDEYVPLGVFSDINDRWITKIFINNIPKCIVYVCSPVDENKYYGVELMGKNPTVIDYKNIFDAFIINKVDLFEDSCKNIQVLSKDFSETMRKYFADFLTIPMAQNCLSKLPVSDQEKRIIQITAQNIRKVNCHFLLYALMIHIPLLTAIAMFFFDGGPVSKLFLEDASRKARVYFGVAALLQGGVIGAISSSSLRGYLKSINDALPNWTEKRQWYGGRAVGLLTFSGIVMGALLLCLP